MCGAKRDAWRVSHVLSSSALYILGQFPHNGDWGRGPGGSVSGHPHCSEFRELRMKNKLQQHSGKLAFLHVGFFYNYMMVVGDLLLHILSAHLFLYIIIGFC